jgi:hypothetical protein
VIHDWQSHQVAAVVPNATIQRPERGLLRKLRTQPADVIRSTSVAMFTTYDCRIEFIPSENEMTIKVLKFSLAAVLVASSLVAFGAVVLG